MLKKYNLKHLSLIISGIITLTPTTDAMRRFAAPNIMRKFTPTTLTNTMQQLSITHNPVLAHLRKSPPQNLREVPFGSQFTDHMYTERWNPKDGWHNAEITAYGPRLCDPAMSCLHYGSEIFEGMKAYRRKDGTIVLFRPRENLKRLNESAKRMCMPEVDIEETLNALKQLLKADQNWVPSEKGASLYIRPFMVATTPRLSASPSEEFGLCIILSPVGPYFPEGFNPISIMVEEKYTRSSMGGVGAIKTGGNYGASMLAQKEAQQKGFSQVLWLDPRDQHYVEEVGAMNIFFVINNEIVTPELTGTILPGITRKSILELGGNFGYTMVERRISIDEIIQALNDGSCTEIFGTGTAAVIAPVGKLSYRDVTYEVNNNQTGPVAQWFYDQITQIQRGEIHDPFGWVEEVN